MVQFSPFILKQKAKTNVPNVKKSINTNCEVIFTPYSIALYYSYVFQLINHWSAKSNLA